MRQDYIESFYSLYSFTYIYICTYIVTQVTIKNKHIKLFLIYFISNKDRIFRKRSCTLDFGLGITHQPNP